MGTPARRLEPAAAPVSIRSDAVRNRRRIVDAAVATFAASGLKATIPEIAAAAGVGNASVYRNFPTKADLVAAVVVSEGSDIARTITSISAQKSRNDGLHAAVSALFAALAENSLLADALADGGAAAFGPVSDALWALVEHGQTVGVISAQLSPGDFNVILCGAVRQLRALDERDSVRWRRAADLVVKAFAP